MESLTIETPLKVSMSTC